ncbi:MAG: lipase maturation factor family protein, partial [Candidatus Acidiferrales bacterium]
MVERLSAFFNWLLGPETSPDAGARSLGGLDSGIWLRSSAPPAVAEGAAPWSGHLWPRWIFLRALGLIYFSAFYSLLFQIKGLIGSEGILPAHDYLQAVSAAFKAVRFWFAPTLLWVNSSDHALMALCWVGLIASIAVFLNIWPRVSLAVCFVCFLSFIGAPPGFLPGLARGHGPSRASLFLLRWEWFRIYFESGVVKLASGDPSWRHLTALEDYYQNGPLPTWIGYY